MAIEILPAGSVKFEVELQTMASALSILQQDGYQSECIRFC
jgi:hypothetical protein